MRILVHDYAGHPFQMQLSRGLAMRGHLTHHMFCGSTHTPRGELNRRADDPDNLQISAITLAETIPKTNFLRRYQLETDYAQQLVQQCRSVRPEVVLSANTPSVSQYRLAKFCQQAGIRLITWLQDIYGLAAYRLLGRKLPGIGHLVGSYFISLDKHCARMSDAIVVITGDFSGVLGRWGVDRSRIHVVHNWAPLGSLPVRPRENSWARAQNLPAEMRFVYSGTLAMKHNPALLLELARTLQEQKLGELVIVSEGAGVRWLEDKAAAAGIRSLRTLGFQPFESMPDVLASADVLVAVLEPDAGVFSVPSKVLTYLCAERALLLAVPRENLAARTVEECGAGCVVAPGDVEGFCRRAIELAESAELRLSCGTAARRYAEKHFDIDHICDRFESILAGEPPPSGAGT